MPDPIQSSSSIPLPPYQTNASTRDPLPYGSTQDTAVQNARTAEANSNTSDDQFQDYLNQSAILAMQSQQQNRSTEFDPAQDIENTSVYKQTKTSSSI